MEFAVNYSEPLIRLLEQGRVRIDRIKLPAWPHLVEKAAAILPVYVHLPLNIGSGLGDAWDSERRALVDWDFVETILKHSGTPMINLHLAPQGVHHPGISSDPADPQAIQRITESTLKDLRAVVRRWGKDMLLVENALPEPEGVAARAQLSYIRTVAEECDVHFLFDISHARLSARELGLDEMEYVRGLPLERTAEIHITGIRKLEGALAEQLLIDRPKEFDVTAFIGKEIDHQAMTEDDFDFLAQVLALIPAGVLRRPWIASMEHGGIGPFWELSLNEETLAQQLPRLYTMIHQPENDSALAHKEN